MTDARTPELEQRLGLALAILRITTGVFFLFWAVEKFVRPDVNAAIWDHFYRIPIAVNFSYVVGFVNTLLALALIAGLWRRFTYGFWTIFHTVSVLATYTQLLNPYTDSNHLYLAGVPIVAVMVTLYLLRDRDIWSLDGRRAVQLERGRQEPQTQA